MAGGGGVVTPVRAPDVVRGDVPELLCRGMPIFVLRQTPEDDEAEPCDGERLHIAEQAVVTDHGNDAGWLVAAGRTVDPCGPNWSQLRAADVAIDWSDRATVYPCLAWLADRGHACLWMLPTTHGGRVEAWDGLTAWDVSAILVARSVGRVARGVGPVAALAGAWHHDPNPGDAYESWGWTAWMRTRVDGRGAVRVYVPTRARPLAWGLAGWYYYRKGYGYQPPTSSGRQTGDAGKLAADRAALADGCALLSPGGVALPDLGAEHE